MRFCRIFNQHGRIPALEKLYRDYTALWQAQSREAVTRGKENGELRRDADPEYLYFYLMMIFTGLVELCLDQPDAPHLAQYCERIIRDTIALMQTLPNRHKPFANCPAPPYTSASTTRSGCPPTP